MRRRPTPLWRLAVHHWARPCGVSTVSRSICKSSGSRGFANLIASRNATGSDSDVRLRLSFAAACKPHPSKLARGGEDSYFACPASQSFAVADGVGGWASEGVDPGEFSRGLLRFAYQELRRTQHGTRLRSAADLNEVLRSGFVSLLASQISGGTTALLGQLHDKSVSILNLGDSGIVVLRPALRTPPNSDQPMLFPRVIFRSSDQTHFFNCPYQLGSNSTPDELDVPDFVRVQVQSGDVVIAATDGVFDNLFDRQLQSIVARHLGTSWRSGEPADELKLDALAKSIVTQAQRIGEQEDSQDIITPFALAAHSEGLNYRGGKLDDATVVVALVCDDGVVADYRSELPFYNNFLDLKLK